MKKSDKLSGGMTSEFGLQTGVNINEPRQDLVLPISPNNMFPGCEKKLKYLETQGEHGSHLTDRVTYGYS